MIAKGSGMALYLLISPLTEECTFTSSDKVLGISFFICGLGVVFINA